MSVLLGAAEAAVNAFLSEVFSVNLRNDLFDPFRGRRPGLTSCSARLNLFKNAANTLRDQDVIHQDSRSAAVAVRSRRALEPAGRCTSIYEELAETCVSVELRGRTG
jgi:hypothetical protein